MSDEVSDGWVMTILALIFYVLPGLAILYALVRFVKWAWADA